MEERRTQQQAIDAHEYLRQLPALSLLDRLPTPMMGVGSGGEIEYANPACVEMLGHPNVDTVTRLNLPKLLTGHESRTAAQCLATLRTSTQVVDWNHEEGYVIHTMLSRPLLLRATDTLLLIGITDVTESIWGRDARSECVPGGRR